MCAGVLRRWAALLQAMGQQTEYMRATTGSGQGGSSCGTTDSSSKSEVSKLIADKHKMLQELDDAKAEAAAATKNLAAVKAQAQVRVAGGLGAHRGSDTMECTRAQLRHQNREKFRQ